MFQHNLLGSVLYHGEHRVRIVAVNVSGTSLDVYATYIEGPNEGGIVQKDLSKLSFSKMLPKRYMVTVSPIPHAKTIRLISIHRDVTSYGLMESKDRVVAARDSGVPLEIMHKYGNGFRYDEAEKIMARLCDNGIPGRIVELTD